MKLKNITQSRDFIVLWLTQSLSSLGTSMTSYALILWSYRQLGTASSIAFLAAFTLLPSIFFSFIAGAIADRWDKKRTMAIGDSVAALGTIAVMALYQTGRLAPWHLYLINFCLSCMNAFQNPSANVVITLLTPKKHFARANGMFAMSGSISSLITPMATTAVFAAGGLTPVLLIDLFTFAIAVSALLFVIKVPETPHSAERKNESFFQSCLFGVKYLLRNRPMLNMILLFMWLNLFAHIGAMGIAPALVLARTGGSEAALGMYNTAVGIGSLVGGLMMTLWRPAKSRSKAVLWACLAMCFLLDFPLALGRTVGIWAVGAFMGNIALPVLNANLTACMRMKVPVELQGRVFSARDTLQLWTMPVGLFLGGTLADRVLEPLMSHASPLQGMLSALVGAGPGSGMALQVLLTVIATIIVTVIALFDHRYRALDDDTQVL
ncbi:MAG TPA: MFS transporter [Clostridia bacterium]|nr:MFS transporter [Clostridia bacterium]